MTENAIVVHNEMISPVADIETAVAVYEQMGTFISKVLKQGLDYGKVPGTGDKPTLLKPGAEKLAKFFGLRLLIDLADKVEDWTGKDHNNEPFFYYRYKAQSWHKDLLIAECEGSCNSWEKKYRYRNASRVCPSCGGKFIIKGKEEYGGGWLCFAKKGGCGAKFNNNDVKITGQEIGQINNQDPAEQVNTIQKMGQKRAIVGAVLLACNASDYFTQDIEDMADFGGIVEGEFVEPPPEPKTTTTPPKVTQSPPQKVEQVVPDKMTLEFAEGLVGNTDGSRYGDLDTKDLSVRINSIIKSLKDERDTNRREDLQMKRDGIEVILKHRNS